MTFLRLTPVVALTFCASFAQAQSTAPKELSALLASQAAAEALTSCDKLGHKVSVTVLDRNGLARGAQTRTCHAAHAGLEPWQGLYHRHARADLQEGSAGRTGSATRRQPCRCRADQRTGNPVASRRRVDQVR